MADNGWSFEEAKKHSVVERLLERCSTYTGKVCGDAMLDKDNWCERCLAADEIEALKAKVSDLELALDDERLESSKWDHNG